VLEIVVSFCPPPHSPSLPLTEPGNSRISRGVVVIESGAKSGSLIATHMALKQGHAVFAIPSALLNPKTQNGN
jgi:hypothetical protein